MAKPRKGEQSVGLETRHIFLDTEVYKSCGHNLYAKPMQVLGRYVEDGVFVLHTTDVTLREVRRQIGDMERELANKANSVARQLQRWNRRYRHTGDGLPVPQALEPSEDSAAYRDFEWTVRFDWKARVHAASDQLVGPVLDRYFERQAPFDSEGSKEFPDAFALLAVENWCAAAQERVYVVSKDKAVGRAARASEHLIAVEGLHRLLALVGSAEGHDIADAARDAFDEPSFRAALLDGLAQGIGEMGGEYRGDRYLEGDVLALEVEELESVADVTILRVDEKQVACVADARLAVSAEIDYTDVSEAWWDREDQRYYGAETGVAEIRDVVAAKIFVELVRDGEDFGLGSVGFLSQDLEVSDGAGDEWPYK
ncbi:MAG: PIN domain-containing protein [Gammaproteobacteria bacterium]|nr:PIN domain-containing protein [Gammaproteobacteria bacterium]